MYSVLNTLSEYTDFYILKNIISYTFWLVFKIAERLQCILKRLLKGIYDKVKSYFSKFVIVMVNICLIWEAAVKKVAAGYFQNKCR